MLKADEMLIFTGKGRKDERSGGMSFVCDEVLTIEQMRVRKGATLMLELTDGKGLKTLVEVLQAGQNNEIGGVSCEVSIRSNGVKAEMYLKNGYIPSDQYSTSLEIQIVLPLPIRVLICRRKRCVISARCPEFEELQTLQANDRFRQGQSRRDSKGRSGWCP